ncbi:hypothetical protein [Microbacterium sp. AK031]|uniref:hypothetical protein n=1 Tax=Microbacterium sp. AK031 TaxID=2723076 RepID=UPI00216930DB|nr:hypothetical protein [Microbacterium sp. AK031]MCS3842280.1 hypothetical protein [Microbacterium sp. AK031]
MDQRPIEGAAPLPAPSFEIAQAYLDELGAVRARREAGVDRRGAAWVGLVNVVTLAVYITVVAFSIGEASVSSSFMTFVGVFLLWVQLANQRREGYGVIGYGFSRRWVVVIVLCVVLLVALVVFFFAGITDVVVPSFVRLIPGALTLLVLGWPAVRGILRSPPADVSSERARLSSGARLATVIIGAMMTLGIWVLSVGEEVLLPVFGLLLMLGNLGWWTAARVSERMPALGAVWAWPQWTAFAMSGGVIAAILLVQVSGDTTLLAYGPIAAAAVFCLHVGSAFLDGRDG